MGKNINLTYTDEMKEQDDIEWGSGMVNIDKMELLQRSIVEEAIHMGFEGEVLIYTSTDEVVNEVYKNRDQLNKSIVGDFECEYYSGNCRGLIQNIKESMICEANEK